MTRLGNANGFTIYQLAPGLFGVQGPWVGGGQGTATYRSVAELEADLAAAAPLVKTYYDVYRVDPRANRDPIAAAIGNIFADNVGGDPASRGVYGTGIENVPGATGGGPTSYNAGEATPPRRSLGLALAIGLGALLLGGKR